MGADVRRVSGGRGACLCSSILFCSLLAAVAPVRGFTPMSVAWNLVDYAEQFYLGDTSGDRVYGGKEVEPKGRYSFMTLLAITYNGATHRCGGSLISRDVVLTAAHCFPTATGVRPLVSAYLGYHKDTEAAIRLPGGNEFGMRSYVMHPAYKKDVQRADLALVFLTKTAPDSMRPVPLDAFNTSNSAAFLSGGKALTMGWGRTETSAVSSILLQAELAPSRFADCKAALSKVVNDEHICAQGSGTTTRLADGMKYGDSCTGDSGGPLVLVNVKTDLATVYQDTSVAAATYNHCDKCGDSFYTGPLLGVVSFGPSICGTNYGVYTRVSKYIGWIDSTIAENGGATRPGEPEMKPAYVSTLVVGQAPPAPPAPPPPPPSPPQVLPAPQLAVWATMPLAIMLGNAGCSGVDAAAVALVVDGQSIPLQGAVLGRSSLMVCDTWVLLSKDASPPSGCSLFVAAGVLQSGAAVSVGDQGQQRDEVTIAERAVVRESAFGGSRVYTPAQWRTKDWSGKTVVGPAAACS